MPPLADLLALDDAAFRKMFAGGPVRRAGHERFLRNVLVAAGNSGDGTLLPAVEACLRHDSPLVRGMAVWALATVTADGRRIFPAAALRNLQILAAAAHGPVPRETLKSPTMSFWKRAGIARRPFPRDEKHPKKRRRTEAPGR